MPDNLKGVTISAPYTPREIKWKYNNKKGTLLPHFKLRAVIDGEDGETRQYPPVPEATPRLAWPKFPWLLPFSTGPCGTCLHNLPDGFWDRTFSDPTYLMRTGHDVSFSFGAGIRTADGLNWEFFTVGGGYHLNIQDYAPARNLYWGMQDNFSHQYLVYGTDMASISYRQEITPAGRFVGGKLHYLRDLDLYMVTSSKFLTGHFYLSYSSDLMTWLPASISNDNWVAPKFASGTGMFIAYNADDGDGRYTYSYDGYAWSINTQFASGTWTNLAWSGPLGVWVLAGPTAPTGNGMRFEVSSDGLAWTEYVYPTMNRNYRDLTWIPELSMFIANGEQNGGKLMSINGTTWTEDMTCPVISNYLPNWIWWPEDVGYYRFIDHKGAGQGTDQKYSIYP